MWFFTKIKRNLKKFAKACRAFLRREHLRERVAIASGFVGMHLLEFYMTNYFVTQTENQDPNDQNQYLPALGNMLLSVSIFTLRFSVLQYLGNSLESKTKNELEKQWLHHKTLIGLDFVQDKKQKEKEDRTDEQEINANDEHDDSLEPSFNEVMSLHVSQFSQGAIAVSIDSLSTMASMAINFYAASRVLNNPKITSVAASFALFIGGICQVIERSRTKIVEKNCKIDGKRLERLTHIEQNKSQIVCMRAEEQEYAAIARLSQMKQTSFKKLFVIDTATMAFLGSAFLGFPIMIKAFGPALGLISPEQLNNKVAMDMFSNQMLLVMAYFRDLFATYTRTYAKMKVSMEQIVKLQEAMDEWEDFFTHHNPFQTVYDQDEFSIDSMSLAIPKTDEKDAAGKEKKDKQDRKEDEEAQMHKVSIVESANTAITPAHIPFHERVTQLLETPRSVLLKDVHLEFQRNQIYRLSGKSGLGKSTILKALVGLWPYASGISHFPCNPNEIQHIPQNPCFPIKSTLEDAICYPPAEKQGKGFAKDKLIELMYILDLADLIPDLKKFRKSWDYLSRGQQQRLAMIRALISKPSPKVLIMDESTASIDKDSKRIIEKLIKEYLKDVIIVYVDHNPSGETNAHTQNAPVAPLVQVDLKAQDTEKAIPETAQAIPDVTGQQEIALSQATEGQPTEEGTPRTLVFSTMSKSQSARAKKLAAATEKSPLLAGGSNGSNHFSLAIEGDIELQTIQKQDPLLGSVEEPKAKDPLFEKTITKEEGQKLRALYLKSTSAANGSVDNFSDFVVEILPDTRSLKARLEKRK